MIIGKKNSIIFFYDFFACLIVFPLASYVRLEQDWLSFYGQDFTSLFFVFLLSKIVSVVYFRLDRAMWGFVSVADLMQILKASTVSCIFSLLLVFLFSLKIPRSILFIDWFLLVFILGGGRFAYRYFFSLNAGRAGVSTLIVGAGRAGEKLVREIKENQQLNIHLTGILDDDPSKMRRTLHGITVLGTIQDLEEIIKKTKSEKVFIAIPSADSELIKDIHDRVRELDLPVSVLTLPSMTDIAGGNVQVSQLRPINMEDLLGRKAIQLDTELLKEFLGEKTVLITGAGGSIGSDLARQVCKYKPKRLILFESCEYFIYKIDIELRESFPGIAVVPIVGDVRERKRLEEVFETFSPTVVVHAAAYKHVPMMELNPGEAIKTNVYGTKNVAEVSAKAEVDSFVLVSTDKAVNPSNIMGATKRLAELYIQTIQQRYPRVRFGTVRFGNVLGSNGSVIPRFLDQIKKGGPVTVTHPEVTRYFMSIPEATQLVLQAGAMTKGGEVFVLDMGKPINICELAKELIRLCGFVPEKDISITFTGLRQAEKLSEDLIFDEESTLVTPHPLLRIVKADSSDLGVQSKVREVVDGVFSRKDLRAHLAQIFEEFNPPHLNQ